MKTIVIQVTGKVQGVFFRQGTREKALTLGLTGTVLNLADGSVEVTATGTDGSVTELIAWCGQGPPKAIVRNLEWKEVSLKLFDDFTITRHG